MCRDRNHVDSGCTCKQMAQATFNERDADSLYGVLANELGASIAAVIWDEGISGEDFLKLTEDEVASLFSKKVLQVIEQQKTITAEVNVLMLFAKEIVVNLDTINMHPISAMSW